MSAQLEDLPQNLPEQEKNGLKKRRWIPIHPIRGAKRILMGAAALLMVGALCFFAGGVFARRGKEDATQIQAVVLSAQLQTVSELATVSYHYTNMGQFENANEFYGVKLPFTTKSFILTYDGVIKAGVDLSAAAIDVFPNEVKVSLPAAAVLSHTIDEQSLEVFDEKTSIFNPFTVEDYNGFQADQKKVMEQKALANGLLEDAAQQAKKAVTGLLTPLLPDQTSLVVTVGK